MLFTRNLFLLKKAKGKQILSQKWEESSVFGVALHNIWLTSAVMSNLHVITVGSLGIWLRHACTVYMKSVKSSGNSSIILPLYKLTVTIGDQEILMEVVTGSSVTLLSSADFTKIRGQVTNTQTPYSAFEKLY